MKLCLQFSLLNADNISNSAGELSKVTTAEYIVENIPFGVDLAITLQNEGSNCARIENHSCQNSARV